MVETAKINPKQTFLKTIKNMHKNNAIGSNERNCFLQKGVQYIKRAFYRYKTNCACIEYILKKKLKNQEKNEHWGKKKKTLKHQQPQSLSQPTTVTTAYNCFSYSHF